MRRRKAYGLESRTSHHINEDVMPIVIKFAVMLCGTVGDESLDRIIANGDLGSHYFATYKEAQKQAAAMRARRPDLTYIPVAIAMEKPE